MLIIIFSLDRMISAFYGVDGDVDVLMNAGEIKSEEKVSGRGLLLWNTIGGSSGAIFLA